MRRRGWIGGVVFVAVAMLVALSAQPAAPLRPAGPVDAISGILDAFRTYSVVGMDTGQEAGDARGSAFLLSLIRDPRFTAIVNDLVLEGYSARYQDILDRFVRGEDVPDSALRPLWRDTTQVNAINDEPPLELFRAVRAINAALPRVRQLRVLAPDPPIDWDLVHTTADYQQWLAQRDSFPADLTRREVIGKQRRALAVWGGGHLQRKNQASNYQMDDPLAATYVSLLEAAGTHVFVVVVRGAPIEEEAVRASWPVPSIALLRGTSAGAADVASIMPQGRFSIRNGQLTPLPRDQWISMRVEDQVDAALWLGPASARRTTSFSPAACDPVLLETRARRRALTGRPSDTDPLKQFCATLTPK